ncbi:MAG: TRAP transporter small permease [Desulfobacteraceae bacterium]|nr:MAG: TRAP transporter small permease [Desulfobacteraceae bacterium]
MVRVFSEKVASSSLRVLNDHFISHIERSGPEFEKQANRDLLGEDPDRAGPRKSTAMGERIMEKLEGIIRRLGSVFEYFALINLLMMVAITCIDVVGAKVFLKPVLGAIDLVMLNQLLAISFAGTVTLLLGRHVQVEFIVMLLPKRVSAVVESLVWILTLCFFVVVTWRLFVYGAETGGEVSATARIPLSPFAYAAGVSFIPLCFALAADILKSIRKIGHA